MKPLIGVSARTRTIAGGLGALPAHAVPRAYTAAVAQAGGVPVILPCTEPEVAVEAAGHCDGLLLTGGEDIDPVRYGRRGDGPVFDVDPERDRFEFALARAARDRGQPLLAVCRGMQVVNVALGGDLVVDIPSEVGEAVLHRLPQDGAVPDHPVRLEPGSTLAAAVGTERVVVNSSHHQAIRMLGAGLRPVAWSDDGLIEAVETDGWPCLGVQWHPEHRPPDNPGSRAPFAVLVDAAADADRR